MTAARTRTFSQQDMDDFGVASGGTGLIHTEPQYAAATPFGATLVQGVFLLAVIERRLCELVPGWAGAGRLDVAFVAPVTEGTPFSVEVTEDGQGGWSLRGSTPAGLAVVGRAWLTRPVTRAAAGAGTR